MTLANYLTLIRLFVSPIIFLIYTTPATFSISPEELPYLLLLLIGLAELSDVLDGYLARRYGQVTEIGKILDPMVDSIYRSSIFLSFTLEPIRLPLWLVILFFYRDASVNALRALFALKGIPLAARKSGKIKAIAQGAAALMVTALMIPYHAGYLSLEQLHNGSCWIVGAAAFYALLSGIEYIYAHRHALSLILS